MLLPLLQCVRIGNFCCRTHTHTQLTLLLNVGVGAAVVVLRSFMSCFVAAVACVAVVAAAVARHIIQALPRPP